MKPQDLSIEDYNYTLPDDRIPKYPLDQRDSSKLLVYENDTITDASFNQLGNYLPANTTLIFNDSKVIPVRLFFETPTAHTIEVFCLEPTEDKGNNSAVWKCFVGRLKKWKNGKLSQSIDNKKVEIELVGREKNYCLVQFTWSKAIDSIFEVFNLFGSIPIPPYLNRDSEQIDNERYQNVFANNKGSVAAPTAGLHFTDSLLTSLKETGTDIDFVTLHVGAGTFKPVSSDTIGGHEMHMERMLVTAPFVEKILTRIKTKQAITAVGTTTLRTLESLYWLGVKINKNQNLSNAELNILQWEPYNDDNNISAIDSLQAIANWLKAKNTNAISFTTEILILPQYKFRIIDCLLTNFHQPKSTLLLLVAAAVGNSWNSIYKHALENNYRFLSYGDASLLHLDNDKKIS